MKQLPATQGHINVRKFVDGILIAGDGTMAYVLEVEPLDIGLLEPSQATWIKEQFGRMISQIRFPHAIQIVVGSYPQNMSAYLERLQDRARQELQAAAQGPTPQAQRHQRMADRLAGLQRFIEQSLELVRPIESRYFVVVFHNPLLLRRDGERMTPEALARGRQQLEQLLGLVMAGLGQATLAHRLLDEYEVAEVIHWFYHQSHSPLAGRQTPLLRLMPSLIGMEPSQAPGEMTVAREEQSR
jgi:hypothetical protein